MSEDKNEEIYTLLKRAKDLLVEVDTSIEHEYWNSALNRLYYACFYAVTALLANDNIYAKTHSGLKQMFALHYIKSGKLSEEMSDFYTVLFHMRQSADYEALFHYEKENVLPLIAPARELIFLIDKMLNEATTI